jgi:hypothetical protein
MPCIAQFRDRRCTRRPAIRGRGGASKTTTSDIHSRCASAARNALVMPEACDENGFSFNAPRDVTDRFGKRPVIRRILEVDEESRRQQGAVTQVP